MPRRGLSLLAFRRDRNLGLGRSWPVAFGRTKNISRARPAHRARDAARAARVRRAARKICVFRAPERKTGARLSGRAHRPDDDAVPPMEHIEDDRSEVLAAAEVHRGGLQPLAHAASAAAQKTRTNGGFRSRTALLMLDNKSFIFIKSITLRGALLLPLI